MKQRLVMGFMLFALSTCDNIYKAYNDPQSDKYRIDKARSAIDKSEFDEAIDLLYPVWAANKGVESVAYYYATAHAGRAGLIVMDLISHLATELDNTTVLEALSSFFEDVDDTTVSDINEAIRIIEFTSETPTERSGRMNFLALFANWARIAIVINRYAYSDNTLLIDTFDACKITSDKTGARTGLPNVAADDIMISVPRILELATLVNGTGDVFDTLLGSSFSGLTSVAKTPLPCEDSPNNVRCLAVRSLLNLGSDDSGIGLDTGNFAGSNPGPPVGTCTATYN